MKDYTQQLRDAIVAVLRQSFPLPMSTQQITMQMPWETGEQESPNEDWRWWENRDDMKLIERRGTRVIYRKQPWSSEVYNSLRALECKQLITRIPRDPNRRDRYRIYLPDDKVDTEIRDLDALFEAS